MSPRAVASHAWMIAAVACASAPEPTTLLGAPPATRPSARTVTMEELWATPFGDDLKGMPNELRALSGQQVVITGLLTPIEDNLALLYASLTKSSDASAEVVYLHLPIAATDLPVARVRVQGEFLVGAEWMENYCIEPYGMKVEHLDALEVLVPAETVKKSLTR